MTRLHLLGVERAVERPLRRIGRSSGRRLGRRRAPRELGEGSARARSASARARLGAPPRARRQRGRSTRGLRAPPPPLPRAPPGPAPPSAGLRRLRPRRAAARARPRLRRRRDRSCLARSCAQPTEGSDCLAGLTHGTGRSRMSSGAKIPATISATPDPDQRAADRVAQPVGVQRRPAERHEQHLRDADDRHPEAGEEDDGGRRDRGRVGHMPRREGAEVRDHDDVLGARAAEEMLEHLHRSRGGRLGGQEERGRPRSLQQDRARSRRRSATTRMPNHPPPIKFITCEKPIRNGTIGADEQRVPPRVDRRTARRRKKISAPSPQAASTRIAPTMNSTGRDSSATLRTFGVLHRPILPVPGLNVCRAPNGVREDDGRMTRVVDLVRAVIAPLTRTACFRRFAPAASPARGAIRQRTLRRTRAAERTARPVADPAHAGRQIGRAA